VLLARDNDITKSPKSPRSQKRSSLCKTDRRHSGDQHRNGTSSSDQLSVISDTRCSNSERRSHSHVSYDSPRKSDKLKHLPLTSPKKVLFSPKGLAKSPSHEVVKSPLNSSTKSPASTEVIKSQRPSADVDEKLESSKDTQKSGEVADNRVKHPSSHGKT